MEICPKCGRGDPQDYHVKGFGLCALCLIDSVRQKVVKVKRGKRPSFLARKKVECPECGRLEYANTTQERFKRCSLCALKVGERVEPVSFSQPVLLAVKGLVGEECCEFLKTGPFKKLNYCRLPEKEGCVYFTSEEKKARCPWFEKAVLPLKSDLEEDYGKETGEIDSGARACKGVERVVSDLKRMEIERVSVAKNRAVRVLP